MVLMVAMISSRWRSYIPPRSADGRLRGRADVVDALDAGGGAAAVAGLVALLVFGRARGRRRGAHQAAAGARLAVAVAAFVAGRAALTVRAAGLRRPDAA